MVWVSLPRATFGIVVRDGRVVDGAPYARGRGLRLGGMDERDAAVKLKRIGAQVVPLPHQCDCHEWYPLAEIGGWMHHDVLVRDRASEPDTWDVGNRELSHEELRGRIAAAGGVRCKYPLEATRHYGGEITLANGVHRWAVAAELGVGILPVRVNDAADSPMPVSW
jgi:hypothetical protein